jgi:hypothetical protein
MRLRAPLRRRCMATAGSSSCPRGSPCHSASVRSRWTTWPRACTPASVRPATVTRIGRRINMCRASSRAPWTVRLPGCNAHPLNGPPSYDKSSRTRKNPPPPNTGAAGFWSFIDSSLCEENQRITSRPSLQQPELQLPQRPEPLRLQPLRLRPLRRREPQQLRSRRPQPRELPRQPEQPCPHRAWQQR